MLFNFDPERYIPDRQEVFDNHFPSGTSFRNFIHFAQSVRKEKIEKFDHGKATNLEIYNSEKPPKYDLSAISVPVHVFIGSADWLSTPEDANANLKEMQNLKIYNLDNFDHLEFIRGKRAKKELFPQILSLLSTE